MDSAVVLVDVVGAGVLLIDEKNASNTRWVVVVVVDCVEVLVINDSVVESVVGGNLVVVVVIRSHRFTKGGVFEVVDVDGAWVVVVDVEVFKIFATVAGKAVVDSMSLDSRFVAAFEVECTDPRSSMLSGRL